MLRRHSAKALVALVTAAPILDATALWHDQVSPFVSETVTRDDNVFRLADNVDPLLAIGAPSAKDTYHATSAGFAFDVPVSAQRFEGEVALNRYHFNRFDELDFNGYGARAIWRWRLGQRFNGDFGHDRSESLASLSNVQSGTRSTIANVIKTERTYVTATYEPASRWQLRGDVREATQRNDAIQYRPNDLDARSTELTLAYVTEQLTRIGVIAQHVDGRLPNPEPLGSVLLNNSYGQQSVAAFVEWRPSPHSQLKARAGPTRRDYDVISQRNFDGTTYVATMDWNPTDTLTLTAIRQRDISPNEEINVGLVLSDGVGFHTLWTVREKAALALELERADRTYLGDAASFLGTAAPYAERVRSVGARLSLHPRKPLTVDLGVRHERRSSLTTLGNYGASIASVGFRFAF